AEVLVGAGLDAVEHGVGQADAVSHVVEVVVPERAVGGVRAREVGGEAPAHRVGEATRVVAREVRIVEVEGDVAAGGDVGAVRRDRVRTREYRGAAPGRGDRLLDVEQHRGARDVHAGHVAARDGEPAVRLLVNLAGRGACP